MRASQWLLGLATASAIVGAVASGCGGSTNNNNGSTDAATDVTTDHFEAAAPEAAPEAAPQDAAAEACPVDADVTWPTVPDASLGDSGSTTGACLACVQAACPDLLSECNALCSCKEAFGTFETCVAAGTSITTCGADLVSSGLPLTDCTCAVSCANTCGVTLPGDGGDGGGDSGDAAGD